MHTAAHFHRQGCTRRSPTLCKRTTVKQQGSRAGADAEAGRPWGQALPLTSTLCYKERAELPCDQAPLECAP